jgi:hypothetical protein
MAVGVALLRLRIGSNKKRPGEPGREAVGRCVAGAYFFFPSGPNCLR